MIECRYQVDTYTCIELMNIFACMQEGGNKSDHARPIASYNISLLNHAH